MSVPITPLRLRATPGCTQCGTQQTTTVDGVCGRRCAKHPPSFDPEHAVKLARSLGVDAAMAYVRTELPS